MDAPDAAARAKRGAVVTHHLFDPATGEARWQHCRQYYVDGTKRVWWRSIGRDGKWGLGLHGLRPAQLPLWNAHRLSAFPLDTPIVVTEGEPAGRALDELTVPVVATVTGAPDVPDRDILRSLAGRHVILSRDADRPGALLMQGVARVLADGVAASVRWVNWPDAAPKQDAADFVRLRGADATRALLAAAETEMPPMPPPGPAGDEPPYGRHPKLPGNGPRDTAAQAVLVRLADVIPKKVRWLWPGCIPLGKVTVLDGDPDLGKSLLTLDLAARVTRNDAMPNGTVSDLGEPRGVVLLSAEDDAEDTIRPRLDAADADVGRVVLMPRVRDSQGERGPTIADLAALEDAIRQTAAALVIIDPLMAHLPDGRDAHRDQDIRRALAPLADLAARTGAAVLVIRHLNKSGGGNPLYRGGGSIGIIGAARAGLLVAPDPDEPDGDRRILVVPKSNLAAKPPALAYHVETRDDVPRLAWEGPTEHTAAALLAVRLPEDERSARDDAAAFLADLLGDGGRPAKEVQAAARQAGIMPRTLERARPLAGVVTRRRGFGPGGVWVWSIERQHPHSRQPVDLGENGGHGENDALVKDAVRRFGNPVSEVRPHPWKDR